MLSSALTVGDSFKFLICVELAQAVEFVGQRDRFVGHLTSRGRCVLSLAIATWGSLFVVAQGRQEQNEAHTNFLRGDNDGFATSPAL